MDDDLAATLLLFIENNSLVIFCGAGLSMATPSNLPSARRLAEDCAIQYNQITGNQFDCQISTNIEAIAEFLHKKNQFYNIFIPSLIPWIKFNSDPNLGHEAIADFLAAGVIEFTISTNLDCLIESGAEKLGEKDFYSTVSTQDLNSGSIKHNPLLKLHGCYTRDRNNTIWCSLQLSKDDTIQKRIEQFKSWIQSNLLNRAIIIIGFWSDWGYLNSILENCVSGVEPRTVIVVDPSDTNDLMLKAPELWKWANSNNVCFDHIKESGDKFLDELRYRFSRQYIIKVLTKSIDTYKDIFNNKYTNQISINPELTTSDLYSLRRDLIGIPSTEIVRVKQPKDDQMLIGAMYLHFMKIGAELSGSLYYYDNKCFRLINGSGQTMSAVKRKFMNEPPNTIPNCKTVCVGADDDGDVPKNIVRFGNKNEIIRNDPTRDWITHENFLGSFTGINNEFN